MAVRLSCLLVILIVASFGNGEDAPSTISQVLKIPTTSETPSTFKQPETNSIAPVEQVQDKIEINTPDLKKSGVQEQLGRRDAIKRLVQNAGLGLKQALGGIAPRFSPGAQSSISPKYPLPYKRLNGLRQRRGFGPGQWNQGQFRREDPLNPLSPLIPINNQMPFGGPTYPQGSFGRPNTFSGHGFPNGNGNGQDGMDFNIEASFFDWDQMPGGVIFADVHETEQGAISAQVEMVLFPEPEPYIPPFE